MIRYKQVTGKSENTIADYRVTFKKLFYYFESDPQIGAITRSELIGFFAWLQEDYLAEPDVIRRLLRRQKAPRKYIGAGERRLARRLLWGTTSREVTYRHPEPSFNAYLRGKRENVIEMRKPGRRTSTNKAYRYYFQIPMERVGN